jgi:nucleotide-binding universal stress UspA family protein
MQNIRHNIEHNIRHIVAATDFSNPANMASRRAAFLAKELRAELHLIHVIHPLDLYAGSELSFDFQMHYQQVQQQHIKTQLEQLATELREQFAIVVHASNRIGRAHTEIADYAASINAGLIIAGAQGENSILAKLLGSTALRLLKIAKCPVMIVKNKTTPLQSYRKVVAAVDFSKGCAKVPGLASTIAPNAEIEALLIFDSNQEAHMYKAGMDQALLSEYRTKALTQAEDKLNDILTAQNNKHMTKQILSGYPPEAICARAKALNADLIVIGKHNANNIEDWLLGSVSKGVAHDAECDVLLNN